MRQCDKWYDCFNGKPKEKLCPDGLVFDPSTRARPPCFNYFEVDCGDRLELRKYMLLWSAVKIIVINFILLQSLPRAPMISVPAWTDSTLTLTPLCATSSTNVLMAGLRSKNVSATSYSMSPKASATTPRTPTGLGARPLEVNLHYRYKIIN